MVFWHNGRFGSSQPERPHPDRRAAPGARRLPELGHPGPDPSHDEFARRYRPLFQLPRRRLRRSGGRRPLLRRWFLGDQAGRLRATGDRRRQPALAQRGRRGDRQRLPGKRFGHRRARWRCLRHRLAATPEFPRSALAPPAGAGRQDPLAPAALLHRLGLPIVRLGRLRLVRQRPPAHRLEPFPAGRQRDGGRLSGHLRPRRPPPERTCRDAARPPLRTPRPCAASSSIPRASRASPSGTTTAMADRTIWTRWAGCTRSELDGGAPSTDFRPALAFSPGSLTRTASIPENRALNRPAPYEKTVTIQFNFEWDPAKAKANQKKHGISFEQATNVFRDSRAISVFDEDHAEEEERWITVGSTTQGAVMVVIHTFRELSSGDEATIRIISARRATKREMKDYEATL